MTTRTIEAVEQAYADVIARKLHNVSHAYRKGVTTPSELLSEVWWLLQELPGDHAEAIGVLATLNESEVLNR